MLRILQKDIKKKSSFTENNGSQKKMEVQNGKERGEQDGRGLSGYGVQYTSLHGYIRNTPSDT